MISWQRWSATDVGNRRAENEDALVLRDADGFWAVIDGLGGPDAGRVASAALAYALENLSLRDGLADAVDQLEDVLVAVHEQLLEFSSQQQPIRLLGCTAAVVRITQGWSLMAWVGDVRFYRWRNRELKQLGDDHVGFGTEDLTRLIGANTMLPDFLLFKPQPGDRYLICSDGLHGELGTARIAHWLARDPLLAQRELLAEALAAGGRDNLSFVMLDIGGDDDEQG